MVKTVFWADLYRESTGTNLLIHLGSHPAENREEFLLSVNILESELLKEFDPSWRISVCYGPQTIFEHIQEERLTKA